MDTKPNTRGLEYRNNKNIKKEITKAEQLQSNNSAKYIQILSNLINQKLKFNAESILEDHQYGFLEQEDRR